MIAGLNHWLCLLQYNIIVVISVDTQRMLVQKTSNKIIHEVSHREQKK